MRNDKIVEMARSDGAADPDRARIEAHWRDIGGSRGIPDRADIDPATIASGLDRMILMERIAPRQTRIRLAGQRIAALLDHDLRGMPLSALVVPPSRDWLGDSIEALFDAPARVELGLVGPRSTFRARSRASLMLLPLRDRDGAITRALGFMTLPERAPAPGARFEICGEARRDLQTGFETSGVLAEPDVSLQFEKADRAREVLRRRQQFHIVS